MLLLFVFIIIAVIVVGGDVVAILLLLLFLNFHANVENDLFVVAVLVDNNVVDEIVDKAKLENRLDSKPTHLLLLEGFIIIFVKVYLDYNTTGTVVREECSCCYASTVFPVVAFFKLSLCL